MGGVTTQSIFASVLPGFFTECFLSQLKVEALTLFHRIQLVIELQDDPAEQHIAELFPFMITLLLHILTRFDRNQCRVHLTVLGAGNQQFHLDAVIITSRLDPGVSTIDNIRTPRRLGKKLFHGNAEDFNNVPQGGNRGGRSIVLQLRDVPLGKVGPAGELLLGQGIYHPQPF